MTRDKYSILVVDDDPAFRTLVSTILRTRGYRVREAGSADEATNLFSEHETKLAIVDYKMPGKDGLSWIEKLRDAGRAIPVVFVSGNWCDAKTFNRLRNLLKVSLIVKKPIVPAVFLEQVESLLNAEARLSLQDDGIAGLTNEIQVTGQAGSYKGENIRQLMQMRSKLELKSALKVAQASYVQELAHLWSDLVRTCNEVKQFPERVDLQSHAINEAHKIKGTAGSLNLVAVGEIGAKVESLMKILDPLESTEMEVIWSEINRALALGETEVRKAIEECANLSEEAQAAIRVLVLGDGFEEFLSEDDKVTVSHSRTASSAQSRLKKHRFEACVFDVVQTGRHELFELARNARLPVDGTVPLALVKPDEEANLLSSADELFIGASVALPFTEARDNFTALVGHLLQLRQAQKTRIMVVDDDPVLLHFVDTVLTAHGYNVRTLNNPLNTSAILDLFKPDLLILDGMMPGLTGYEVCRMVREDPAWGKLPVLFLTGKTSAESRAAAFQVGADDFLAKPVLVDELLTRVGGQIAKSGGGRSADFDAGSGLLKEDSFVKAAAKVIDENSAADRIFSIALMACDEVEGIRLVHGIESLRLALLEFGQEVRLRFKAEDLRGKIGYDAVALLVSGEDRNTVAGAIALLQEEFFCRTFKGDRGNFAMTFSAGVADSAEGLKGLKPLLKKAYERMISARKIGTGSINCGETVSGGALS
jgi:DNA-binding response OmpR family regulator